MANLIELGLDVDSFNEQKKARVQEFIALFDQLSKYDGKVINPVLGDGLTMLNSSIKETNVLLDNINSKILTLNSTLASASAGSKNASVSNDELSKTIQNQSKQIDELKARMEQYQKTLANTNATAKETSDTLSGMGSDYKVITNTLKSQADTYRQLYLAKGANDKQTKDALSSYRETSGAIEKMDGGLKKSTISTMGLGKEMSTMYNRLRIISYILPGIGMAGIFSLAFDGIMAAADGLGIFNDELQTTADKAKAINDIYSEQFDLLTKLYDINKRSDISNPYKSSGLDEQLLVSKDRGGNSYDKLNIDTKVAKDKFEEIKKDMKAAFGSEESINSVIDNYTKKVNEAAAKLADVNNIIQKKKIIHDTSSGKATKQDLQFLIDSQSDNTLESLKKNYQTELEISTKHFDLLNNIKEDYYSKKTNLDKQDAKLFKLNQEEERKLVYNTSKEEQLSYIEKNKVVLSDARTTEKERIIAIENIKRHQIELANIELRNVSNNTSSTPNDISIAGSKKLHDVNSADIKENQDILKTEIEFYQRKIAAITSEKKDELDVEAEANLRISTNQEKTLDERLAAYTKYIVNRQHLQHLELGKDIQKGSSGPGGKTSLTTEETSQLYSNDNTQRTNIQADAEKSVFNIVSTSLKKQLSEIINTNRSEIDDNKKKYDEELIILNKSLEDKKIKVEKYKKERKRLDEKYRYLDLDENVQDDELDLQRVRKHLDDLAKLKKGADQGVSNAQMGVDVAKSFGGDQLSAKFVMDEAVGKQKAAEEAIAESKKEADRLDHKLTEDKLKRDLEKFSKLDDMHKRYAANNKKIEGALFEAVKKTVDQGYEYRIGQLDKEQQIRDEGVQAEISAVDKSSLTSKDKNMLDIQLNSQKLQADKNTKAEEKKLKIDEAIFDRKMTVAHILWNTQQAISAARTMTIINPALAAGLALQEAILGAIEIAAVVSTSIPSFKLGVKGFEGGFARYGEDGSEIVKEPYKSPYLVTKETVSFLPKGTDIVPINDNPNLLPKIGDDGWSQTKWLAKQIAKNNKEVKNIFRPVIKLDLNFESYKSKILGR